MTYRQSAKWLLSQTKGMRGRLLWRILVGTLRVAVTLWFVIVCKQMVDVATGFGSAPLWIGAVQLILCIALQLSLSAIGSRLTVDMSAQLTNALRQKLFARALYARWSGRREMHTSDLMERMKKDVDTIVELLAVSLPTAVITAIQLVGAAALLAWLDWRLCIVLVAIMPIALLLGRPWLGKMRRLSRQIRSTDSGIHTLLQEHLRHRTLDAAFSSRRAAVSELETMQSDWQATVMRRNTLSIATRTAVSLGFSAGYATAFIWGVNSLMAGSITFGVLTAFLQLVAQIQRPTVELARQVPGYVYATASVERLQEILELPAEDDYDEQSAAEQFRSAPGLRLDDVSFAYEDDPDGKPVFQSLSYDFRPGSLTAVTGPTGAGKTTLMRLLLALVAPSSGSISLYTDENRSTPLSPSTRRHIVYVPQGNTLLSGTIADNLRLANRNATEEEMAEALRSARADFVMQLPEGLQTRVGEGGIGLSEGQAQRIAIARALLRPGRIMLFDEPTSALDPQTESELLETIRSLAGHRTIILITHRPATATACDSRLHL